MDNSNSIYIPRTAHTVAIEAELAHVDAESRAKRTGLAFNSLAAIQSPITREDQERATDHPLSNKFYMDSITGQATKCVRHASYAVGDGKIVKALGWGGLAVASIPGAILSLGVTALLSPLKAFPDSPLRPPVDPNRAGHSLRTQQGVMQDRILGYLRGVDGGEISRAELPEVLKMLSRSPGKMQREPEILMLSHKLSRSLKA